MLRQVRKNVSTQTGDEAWGVDTHCNEQNRVILPYEWFWFTKLLIKKTTNLKLFSTLKDANSGCSSNFPKLTVYTFAEHHKF